MKKLDYGIIGNCKSAVLINSKGSIDWCCLPEFNSSSVFAKILDNNKGGNFGFIVSKYYQINQRYLENTNILITDFNNGKDHFHVLDFMPRYITGGETHHYPPDIIRYIKLKSGNPKNKNDYNPKIKN